MIATAVIGLLIYLYAESFSAAPYFWASWRELPLFFKVCLQVWYDLIDFDYGPSDYLPKEIGSVIMSLVF